MNIVKLFEELWHKAVIMPNMQSLNRVLGLPTLKSGGQPIFRIIVKFGSDNIRATPFCGFGRLRFKGQFSVAPLYAL